MNSADVGKLLTFITGLWPEFKITERVTNAAWLDTCRSHGATYDEARAAVSYLRDTGRQYPPNAAEFVTALKAIRAATAPRELTPEEKWAKLLDWASRGLSIATARVKCTVRTWRALEFAGGWQSLKTCPTERLEFMRSAFIRAYTSATQADLAHGTSQAAIEHVGTLALVKNVIQKLEAK